MPPRNMNLGNTQTANRPRNARRTLRVLMKYLSRSAPLLIAALTLTVLGNVFQLIGPTLCGYAIDATAGGAGKVDFPRVFRYAAMMLVLYITSAGVSYLVAVLILHVSQRTVRDMRNDVFAKLMRLPVGYFDRRQTGDILSHISYDIDTVNTSLSNDLVQILTSVITVVGAFSMMVRISPPLVLVFGVTVPLSVLFTRSRSRKVRPLYRDRSKKLGELNGFAEEYVSGQKTVRAYHREADVLRRFDEKNEAAVQAYYSAEYFASGTGPSVNFINNLSLTLVSIFGALMYLMGGISIGSISSFVLYSRKFSGPINEAANIFSELQSALAAAERVFTLLDEEEEPADVPGAQPLNVTKGEVSLENIDFGYVPDRPILQRVSLKAPPGSMVAIVGPTGAGKTTLVNLLMRFYDPQAGVISIDGQPIAYYFLADMGGDDDWASTGYTPALLNGTRVNLMILFDSEHPYGVIDGAEPVYPGGETETQAKNLIAIGEGDVLQFLCDYYDYEGKYQDSYYLGQPVTLTADTEIANTPIGDHPARVTYCFTDYYQQRYWTPARDYGK